MNDQLHQSSSNRQQGIALIIVLGFLSIMVLMAVTMAVSMRTERLAAEYGMDYVQSRQFLKGAVDAAVQEVSTYIATDGSSSRPANLVLPDPDGVFPIPRDDWKPSGSLGRTHAYELSASTVSNTGNSRPCPRCDQMG